MENVTVTLRVGAVKNRANNHRVDPLQKGRKGMMTTFHIPK